jgi:CubicO group peptidase (beta-lactamase class C family)
MDSPSVILFSHVTLATVLFAFALAGCATTSQPPEAVVDALMSKYTGDVPGASVLVVRDGTVLYRKAFGLADVESGVASTTATNYRLASISKQFTATAVMMLVERGALTYDTRLTEIFDGFPEYGQAISLSNLLSHTSGLMDYEDLISDTATVQVKDADILQMMKAQTTTYFEPGSAYRYSNTAYALLAMTVERYSGERFADFLRENIFAPAGMHGTVAYESGVSSVPNRAFGHVFDEAAGFFVRRDQSITSAVLGDGGIYSSIDDLQKWDGLLYTEQLLPAHVFEDAWTPKPNTVHDEGEQYGYGWYVDTLFGEKNLRHSGSTIGFRNDLERFPRRRLTVIVLTNRDAPDVKGLAREIAGVYLSGRESGIGNR